MISNRRIAAEVARKTAFCPDEQSNPEAYAASLSLYREALRQMLGWPLTEPVPLIETKCEQVSQSPLGRICHVRQRLFSSVETHGLLFLPAEGKRHPLVFAQHGGHGTPELAAGLEGGDTANYNAMIYGLRERGVAVFAQQLLVWDKGQEPTFDQNLLDREFRQLGGSRAALDLCQLQASFNWLLEHAEIDPSRVGMVGLSYGGFYTLLFSALETRIKVAVSSCFMNDRYRYNWEDLVWTGSAQQFFDSEIARMICPRPLFLEAGEKDEVFAVDGFPPASAEVESSYAALGIAERFQSRVHTGGHEYDPDGKAQDFLLRWL